MTEKKTPEMIEDADLDQASGGLGLLVPAVQKVRGAAVTSGTPVSIIDGTSASQIDRGGKVAGDGSV